MLSQDAVEEPLMRKVKTMVWMHRELLIYGVVGALTTAVSWIASFVLKLFLNDQILWQNASINALSWISAIAFAYPANRKYVFESRNGNILQECAEFTGSRIATGVLEVGLMSIAVNALNIDFWVSKLIVSIVVVVANYILSKLLVFKEKNN